MVASPPSLAEVLEQAIGFHLGQLHIAMPAKVTAYDPVKQEVKALPCVKVPQPDGSLAALPVVGGVPVVFPAGGGYSMTWPLSPGDEVLLVFTGHSMDDWLMLGGSGVEPQSKRRHSLSDAVAIAGIKPFTSPRVSASPTDMVLGRDDGTYQVRISASDVKLGDATAVTPIALGTQNDGNWNLLTAWAAQVTAAINSLISGAVTPLAAVQSTSATKVKGV